MIHYKKLFMLILSLFILITASSQKAPVKFGKIDMEDLEMKVYPTDTSAVAAILCDYGYFSSQDFSFTRILRIKIFQKEGTSWGDRIFPTSSKTNIRGITYNLEDGKVVKTKLKNESIFREQVSEDYYRIRVAMPNVQEGSIIDLEFKHPWLPSEWRFQDIIPVSWSELIIERSPYIEFRRNFFGFEPLSVNTPTRWVGENMPAFKEEPYMSSFKNYISKFDIEVLNIKIPGSGGTIGFFREYCSTWDAVNYYLINSQYFGMAMMQGGLYLNSIAKDISGSYETNMEKLIAAHQAIKEAMKWNEEEALYISSENLRTPFSKKIGNAADINLNLIILLKKIGFDVYPVALSTRDNGFLSPINPSLDKLNYVVAYVFFDGAGYFLDATDEYLTVDMLPPRCINLDGRIIDEVKSAWITLIPAKKNKKVVQYDFTLEDDFLLNGKITVTNYDYAAYNYRKDYDKYNSEDEYLSALENRFPGLEIHHYSRSGADSIYLPVQEIMDVTIKNRVSASGDSYFINPLMLEQVTVNPFRIEYRNYPVDFIYPAELVFSLRLTLPDGYQVKETPKPVALRLKDNSLSALYQVTMLGQTVQVTYKFMRNKTIFSNEEYPDMRSFFSELVKKHTEPIVLVKL
jgi:hypothetical protein